MAKVRVKNKFNGILSLKAKAGSNKETINLAADKVLTFDSESEYVDYAPSAEALKTSKMIDIALGDAKFTDEKKEDAPAPAPEKPAEEPVEPAEEPVEPAKKTKKVAKKTTKKTKTKKQKKAEIQAKLTELQKEFSTATKERKAEIKEIVLKLKDEAKKLK